MSKALIFHIFPRYMEFVEKHIKYLSQYKDIFSKIYVKIPIEDLKKYSECLGMVNQYLPSAEIYAYPSYMGSDPVGFLEIIEKILNDDKIKSIFYCHGKGTSLFPGHNNWVNKERLWAWSKAMYDLNLKNSDLIDKLFLYYSCAGVFKRGNENDKHDGSVFHYSGAYFWLNCEKLKQANWKNISGTYYGTESYPGRIFDTEKAFCWYESNIDLYFKDLKEEEYALWLQKQS